MFGLTETSLLVFGGGLAGLCGLPALKAYRGLLAGAAALVLITALFPRDGNPLGQYLFSDAGTGPRLPREGFGILWWVLGAWLVKSLLDLVLRRTIFPDNDEPHARRLFADLAAMLIYVLAFFGMLGTVFHQPVSTFLATSGVLAIILGLALQNTLGDVLAGLAINIERPFAAGDWITVGQEIVGQVIQVNWRATRLRTWANDLIVIPNSLVTKAIVTNHSRPRGAHRCVVRVAVDGAVPASRVIAILLAAAAGGQVGAKGTQPTAYAAEFADSLLVYELAFSIENFAAMPAARSAILRSVAEGLRDGDIPLGALATDVRAIKGEPRSR